MSEEQAFLAALAANPADDLTRLVYADWLDEHGHQKSRYLRLVTELALMPREEMLQSQAHDEILSLSAVLHPDWLEAVGRRFELALIRFNMSDRLILIRALSEWLHIEGLEAEQLTALPPIAVSSPLTYSDAFHRYIDWLRRYRDWFSVAPSIVMRPLSGHQGGANSRFDIVLRELPQTFWPNWGLYYKMPVSDLLGLPTREAADRMRKLPAVLFRSISSAEVEPTLRRVRQVFNRPSGLVPTELLSPDALSVVPTPPEDGR
jgi:uncharacterized protein (TIGR02996 family)